MRNRRRREKHLADNRAAHDFASYIADFINGYCFGHAIQVQTEDEDTQEKINGLHNLNDIDTHNRSIGLDLSILDVLMNTLSVTKMMRLDYTNLIHATHL